MIPAPNNVLLLTEKELRDARRNRWFLLYTAAFAALALALSWFGVAALRQYGFAGFGRTSASLINLVLLIVPLMGLTLGALSIAGEREQGTLMYMLAQPVTLLEILSGKFIGLALALLASLILGFGLSGVVIAYSGGTAQAGVYLGLILMSFLLALVSLAIGVLISAAVRTAAVGVGLAVFLWAALVFFGDLGLMGTSLVLELPIRQLFALSLLNPLHVFKMAAILATRGNLEVLGPAGQFAVRNYEGYLLPLLIIILLLWVAVPFCLTYWIFRRKGAL